MTLFLDLDGPILETAERNFQVHRAVLTELGREMKLERLAFWELKRAGKSSAELLSLEPGPPVKVELFKRRWLEEIELPRWLALDTVQPGAQNTLTALGRSCRLVLVTLRQNRALLEDQLARLRLEQHFSLILCASPLGGKGWETKCHLIGESGFSPGDVVAGDSEVDIRAGKLLGLTTVGVHSGIRSRAALVAEQPSFIVEDITRLQQILS